MNAVHPPARKALNTAGKIFGTFLAIFCPVLMAVCVGKWMTLLMSLHSASLLRDIWMNPKD